MHRGLLRRVFPLGSFVATCAVIFAACNSDSTSPQTSFSLAKSSGDSQTVLAGGKVAAPIVVKLTSNGAPLSGATVTWTTGAVGGTLTPTTSTTDANGLAQTLFTSPQKAGADTIRATSSNSLVAFVVKIIADTSVGALIASGGNGAATLVGFGIQLTAKATDLYGNARPGIVVNFSTNAGILSKTTVTTDSSGQAAVQYTPGPTAGTYTVQASANRFQSITFSVSAL
jgi:Big-like domain-containing protein